MFLVMFLTIFLPSNLYSSDAKSDYTQKTEAEVSLRSQQEALELRLESLKHEDSYLRESIDLCQRQYDIAQRINQAVLAVDQAWQQEVYKRTERRSAENIDSRIHNYSEQNPKLFHAAQLKAAYDSYEEGELISRRFLEECDALEDSLFEDPNFPAMYQVAQIDLQTALPGSSSLYEKLSRELFIKQLDRAAKDTYTKEFWDDPQILALQEKIAFVPQNQQYMKRWQEKIKTLQAKAAEKKETADELEKQLKDTTAQLEALEGALFSHSASTTKESPSIPTADSLGQTKPLTLTPPEVLEYEAALSPEIPNNTASTSAQTTNKTQPSSEEELEQKSKELQESFIAETQQKQLDLQNKHNKKENLKYSTARKGIIAGAILPSMATLSSGAAAYVTARHYLKKSNAARLAQRMLDRKVLVGAYKRHDHGV
jgi:hypothetical protein